MILIVISWIYILFTTINLGFLTDKIVKLKNQNFVITSILGLFSVTLLASIWAIFGRINIEFHIFLLLLNISISLRFKDQIITIYKLVLSQFKDFQIILKIVFIAITLLIIAQCSSIPFILDNESYYIQTIKWINEYGFIKGLANLHLFLGQTSGWHVTQSVFNFSFLYKNFNDLSGYCLLLGTFFSIQKLNDFYTTNNRNYLVVGLLPLFNIFLFQFISAPSPDVPVYIFSIILFFYFLENFKKPTPEVFYLIVILVLFLVYIKNTMLTFGIIPIILLTLHFKIFSKKLLIPILLTTLVISLFIIKNMIICGSPIFPSKSFNNLSMVYAIPDAIENFYYDSIKHYGYAVTAQQYNSMSSFHLFLKWLTLPKLHGLFNSLIIFLIILVPFFIYKFQNKKSLWILYIVMVLQLVLLFMTSPQYRFFMNFILFFSLFCFACLIQNKKIINSLLALSQVPVIIVLFISVNFNGFSNNTFMQKSSNFSISNIVFPHTNTKNNTNFITVKLGNLNYNSPINNDFFWGNGDGALPCVNKDQIEYFKKYFNTVPQMRTNDLKDGFYAKKLSGNE
ncbi:LIC_10190 family membrane protein [Flavobacterium bizetiae]|uniref:LIC_10190 family membrane protein n=3 Tax=Flavobacterium bizetiae TaxID=2704140 RepID=UPI00174B7DAB|nr:hypothetical protein [Flavobacterium bizetiae]CAD5344366.1 hypothetical protein FLA105535_04372 [Flavobacterium bizetiae]CAD5350410.1 hypothetical protein FLA105534_04400 [Flavobacterium bizetiae]